MSYYYRHNLTFSYHGLQRCRERLNLKDVEDYRVKEVVLDYIRNSTRSFETNSEIYISAGNTDLYFVINKKAKLILTITKISPDKQLSLMGYD